MHFREELKLYQELKDISLPSSKDSLDELLKKKDIYDINPNTNFEILQKYIDEDNMEIDNYDEQFKNFYLNYIQTLTFNQKNEIIKKIKNNDKGKLIESTIGFNEKSNIENYFDILNIMKTFTEKKSFGEYSKFKNLFFTKYYVENDLIKIPLIYGTNELKYGGLISNLYQNLFIKNSTNKDEENNNNINNQDDNNNYPENIIKIKTISKNNTSENQMDVNDEIDENEENGNIFFKCKFINRYLNKICNEEFYEFFNIKEHFQFDDSKNFEQEYKLSPQIDSLFFHLLYFDLIFSIYSIYGDNDYISNFENNFFETKMEKFSYFNTLNKIFEFKNYENKQKIEFNTINDIQNTDYLLIDLKNKDNTLKFNPYDYSVLKLRNMKIKGFDEAKRAFNNPNNFSLNFIYKNKRLFNDENLSKLFNENIRNMLKSNIINDLYNQYENFKNFSNPYKKEEFINQTFDIILYLPIPFKLIGGFTYKNFGLIFLSNIELIKRNDSSATFFCKKISNLSFKKVTSIHEIVCHYSSVIIHANKRTIGLLTPPNTFIDYEPIDIYEKIFSDYDGGDRGEAILFGNKIKYIFIKGALFILNNENWKLKLEEFKIKFIFENNPDNSKNDIFDVTNESSKDKIIDHLLKTNKDFIQNFKTNKNLKFRFRLNSYYNDENEYFQDGILYWNRASHKSIISKKKINN